MTIPAATSTEARVGDSWSVQQKARKGGARQRPTNAQGTETQSQADAAPAVTKGQKPSTSVKAEAPAAKWQHGWAELSPSEMAERAAQLQEMGFTTSAARSALEVCDWDVNRALDSLFTHNVPANANDPESDVPRPLAYFDLQGEGKSCGSFASESTSASSSSSPRSSLLMTPQIRPDFMGVAALGVAAFPGMPPMPLLPPTLPLMPLAGVNTMIASPPGINTLVMATQPVVNPLSGVRDIAAPAPQALNAITASTPHASVSPVSLVAPKRKLAKVEHTWTCDAKCSDTQLSVEEGTFVYVWSDSKTAEGWIYAESLICSSRAGWLPASMLQQLPPNERWMRVSKPCNAIYPTQMTVNVGNIILVDASQTPVGDGWVYAEQLESATGHCATDIPCISGWVPIQCIMWAEV